MSYEDKAQQVAARIRQQGKGFLTMRKDELREAFGIGRMTEGLSATLEEALGRQGVFVHPSPYWAGTSLRLYDVKHPLASLAEAVTKPDVVPDTALRKVSDAVDREVAGKNLRSDDAPWLIVFDLFLQVVLGREPDGWEELRDDRHPSELARELSSSLGLLPGTADSQSTLRIAAAVCAVKPKKRSWLARDFLGTDDNEAAVFPLLDGLAAAGRRAAEDHERVLGQAARLLLRKEAWPSEPVELGLLGLRYRRETNERSV